MNLRAGQSRWARVGSGAGAHEVAGGRTTFGCARGGSVPSASNRRAFQSATDFPRLTKAQGFAACRLPPFRACTRLGEAVRRLGRLDRIFARRYQIAAWGLV